MLPERPVVLHASDEDEAVRAARALHAVGLFAVAGWQVGGGAEQLEPVSLDELERLLADDAVELLDVREADERDDGLHPRLAASPLPHGARPPPRRACSTAGRS